MDHRKVLIGFVALLIALPLLPVTPEFWITQMNYIGLASLVVLGLVLLTGVGGLTSFGQAAFVGIGAYTTAWFSTRYGGSPLDRTADWPDADRFAGILAWRDYPEIVWTLSAPGYDRVGIIALLPVWKHRVAGQARWDIRH